MAFPKFTLTLHRYLTYYKNHTMSKQILIFLFFIFTHSACLPFKEKVDVVSSWTSVPNSTAERVIRQIHATPFELYAITDNQFFRFDRNLALLEKRPLRGDLTLYGAPSVTDNTFFRVSQNPTDNRQVLEFYLARNPSSVKRIITTEFLAAGETFRVDDGGRNLGAFSTDGARYYLFGTVYPANKPVVLIFDLVLDGQANDFISITLNRRVEIPNLTTDGKLQSCRYIGGNFYIATKEGGYRITPTGVVTKLATAWLLDFFVKTAKIYATPSTFNNFDFYSSADNGVTWQRSSVPTALNYTEVAGTQVFSQVNRGTAYTLADSTLTKTKAISYNSDFPTTSFDIYNSIAFFENKYFINVDKQLFYIKDIATK